MNKQILDQVSNLIQTDGMHETFLDGVKIFKTSISLPPGPLLYGEWLVLVLQGRKRIKLNEHVFTFDSDNYLVSTSTLPFECDSLDSEDNPLIVLLIPIDKKVMCDIMSILTKEIKNTSQEYNLGVFTDKVTKKIQDITLNLLCALHSKEESLILGPLYLKELYYQIFKGENAHFLYKMFSQASSEAKITNSIKTIHNDFQQHIDIAKLARDEGMSTSSFHAHFKKVTSHSPLQYIKKIRLHKAKSLIQNQHHNVNDTADKMGYVSVSQFSKDFKSYFGYPPKDAKPLAKESYI